MGRRIVIIGNGIAGITTARYVRKRDTDAQIIVISGETDHFFSRTALMYIYMGHMTYENTKPYEDRFWDDNRIELVRAWVREVQPEQKRIVFEDGADLSFDVLVLATGSKSNKFGWPGQDLPGVQGLYSYQDLEAMERNTREIQRGVVVGGGLIGVETAEMLHSRGIPTTMLVREASWMQNAFPADESAMINKEIRDHGIDLQLSTELERIEAGPDGRVQSVVTKDGRTIECGFVALTIGVSPNIDFLRASPIELDRGVLVDAQLQTSHEGIYAAGDCVQLREPVPGRRPVEPIWYCGRAMGQCLAATICGEPTPYCQATWFNSAKFFDLEWQVYGNVPARLPEDQDTLYWEHPTRHKAIRVNFKRTDQTVTGFQTMGIRYRHETCHQWLEQSTPLPEVMAQLGAANFDPEFFTEHEADLVAVYNQKFPDKPIRRPARRGWKSWLRIRRVS